MLIRLYFSCWKGISCKFENLNHVLRFPFILHTWHIATFKITSLKGHVFGSPPPLPIIMQETKATIHNLHNLPGISCMSISYRFLNAHLSPSTLASQCIWSTVLINSFQFQTHYQFPVAFSCSCWNQSFVNCVNETFLYVGDHFRNRWH